MKKLNLVLFQLLIFLTMAQAANYKILFLNSHKIKINGQPAKIGDVFDDKSTIRWSEERQAIKVINMETNGRYLFVAKMAEGVEQTPYDILTRNKHLSTHDENTEINSNIIKLKMRIDNEYYLMDSIELPTELKIDASHYFLVTYQYGDTKLTKKLKHNNGNIVIDKSIFLIDGKKLDPRDITLSISYMEGKPENIIFIKGKIKIIVIPDSIE